MTASARRGQSAIPNPEACLKRLLWDHDRHLGSKTFRKEGRTRWAQTGELGRGSNGRRRAVSGCDEIATRSKERLGSGCQQIDSPRALLTCMLLGVLNQSLTQPMRSMPGTHHEGSQQCVNTVELHANDGQGRHRWSHIEEILHGVVREVARRKCCTFQQRDDVRALRPGVNCPFIRHGYPTFFRLLLFDNAVGLHAVAHAFSALMAQQSSVR